MNRNRTPTTRATSAASLIYGVAIVSFIASYACHVQAIRCHQCNSHLEEDCNALRLSVPHAPPDNQYLKECKENGSAQAFCRKEVIYIAATEERRIARTCGWRPFVDERNLTCYDDDNEGYLRTVCECNTDGCNGARGGEYGKDALLLLGMATVIALRILNC